MEQLSTEVLIRLDALAATLGVGVNGLWDVLLKQAIVSRITFSTVTLISVSYLIYVIKWFQKHPIAIASEPKLGEVVRLIAGIMAVLVLLFGIEGVYYSAIPEYYALSKILSMLGI